MVDRWQDSLNLVTSINGHLKVVMPSVVILTCFDPDGLPLDSKKPARPLWLFSAVFDYNESEAFEVDSFINVCIPAIKLFLWMTHEQLHEKPADKE